MTTFRDTSADRDNAHKLVELNHRIITENAALKAEVAHWKANHENMVNRSRVLIDRTDLPLERVQAFRQIEKLQAENELLRAANRGMGRLVDEVQAENERLRAELTLIDIAQECLDADTE